MFALARPNLSCCRLRAFLRYDDHRYWEKGHARSAPKPIRRIKVLFTFSSYQVGRRRRDQDRRYLFRGWSRLYLHAASLSATEQASALVAATGTAPLVSATSAVDPAVNLGARRGRRGTYAEQHGAEAGDGNGLSATRPREQRIIRASGKVGRRRVRTRYY